MPCIRVLEGSGSGTVAMISGGKLTIGREADNGLLVDGAGVELLPCRGGARRRYWHLDDLGSSNGMWTDAQRVESMILVDGSTLRIGRAYLRFVPGEDPQQTQPGQSGVPRSRVPRRTRILALWH